MTLGAGRISRAEVVAGKARLYERVSLLPMRASGRSIGEVGTQFVRYRQRSAVAGSTALASFVAGEAVVAERTRGEVVEPPGRRVRGAI